jgi:hypothetical protein
VVVEEEMPKIARQVPTTSANGVVILALKSKMQSGKGKQPATVAENGNSGTQLAVNLFNGVVSPGSPLSENLSPNDPQSDENKSKTLAACRRQMGPHRFQL